MMTADEMSYANYKVNISKRLIGFSTGTDPFFGSICLFYTASPNMDSQSTKYCLHVVETPMNMTARYVISRRGNVVAESDRFETWERKRDNWKQPMDEIFERLYVRLVAEDAAKKL